MRIYPTRQGDLLANIRTCRRGELDLSKICLSANDSAADGCRADIDEEELALDEF